MAALPPSSPSATPTEPLGDVTVTGEPRVFRAPGEYEFSHVMVRGVMTALPEGVPHEHRNVAYTIEMDGISVCHLGDLSRTLTTRQVEELKPVDVALVPAGGHCTLTLDQALQTIQDLDPRVVVPMHFGTARRASPSTASSPSSVVSASKTRRSRNPDSWSPRATCPPTSASA